MHYMPDTENEDSAAEEFWPEGYKKIIKEDVQRSIVAWIKKGKILDKIYRRSYSEKFSDINVFVTRIAHMIAIEAENGADDAFNEVVSAFLTESPLPEIRAYARYHLSGVFSEKLKKKLSEVIKDEYRQDDIYKYAYKVGYRTIYRNFDGFMDQVTQLVVTGIMNGADDMIENIYRFFLLLMPMPPARRHPRRLRIW